MDYNIYMEEVDSKGIAIVGTRKNLEKDFIGLKYIEAKGINDIGEAKNVYTEDYSDAHTIRAFVPDDITNKATNIGLQLLFLGSSQQDTFDAFNEYIRHGRHRFWDDVRKKSFIFIVTDDIKVEEEEFKNGQPYMRVNYTLKNLQGLATKIL